MRHIPAKKFCDIFDNPPVWEYPHHELPTICPAVLQQRSDNLSFCFFFIEIHHNNPNRQKDLPASRYHIALQSEDHPLPLPADMASL